MADEYDVAAFVRDVRFIDPVSTTNGQIGAILTSGWIRFVDVAVY